MPPLRMGTHRTRRVGGKVASMRVGAIKDYLWFAEMITIHYKRGAVCAKSMQTLWCGWREDRRRMHK